MKRFAFPAFLFSLSLLCAHDDWSLNNHWTATADFLYMKRTQLRNKTLAINTGVTCSSGCPFIAADTKDLLHRFGFEEGYRLAAGYLPNQRSTWEVSFMHLEEWDADKGATANGTLSFPFDANNYAQDFTNASAMHASYESEIESLEGNYWRHVTPRRVNYFSGSWLLGLRYIPFKEHFDLAYFKGHNKSNYTIRTENELYGVQGGVNLQVNPDVHWSWDVTIKVGPMLNCAEQHSFLGDHNNSTTLRKASRERHQTAFLADAAIQFAYQWGAHFNLHAGYQMLYLTGVAIAAEQIDDSVAANASHGLNSHGQVLVHGLFVGLTFGF